MVLFYNNFLPFYNDLKFLIVKFVDKVVGNKSLAGNTCNMWWEKKSRKRL